MQTYNGGKDEAESIVYSFFVNPLPSKWGIALEFYFNWSEFWEVHIFILISLVDKVKYFKL